MAKAKKVVAIKPDSIERATEFIQEIGQIDRQIASINKSLNDKIEKLKADATAVVNPLSDHILGLANGLYEFAEANRSQLTDGGKIKTITLPTGTMAWKETPPAVHLKNVESVIAAIKKLNLADKFLRNPPPEVNKEAMLNNKALAETIEGVSIENDELFVIKPSGTDAEIKKKLKAKAKK